LDGVLDDNNEDRETDDVDDFSTVANGTFVVCENTDDISPEFDVVAYANSNSVTSVSPMMLQELGSST
jgi:hypothetical protein